MTNSQLMLNAVMGGLTDDATTAAALDAIREESGFSLLAAALEVSRVHRAAVSAREMSEAQSFLLIDNPLAVPLRRSITAKCPNLPDNTFAWIMVGEGAAGPHANVSVDNGSGPAGRIACIMVGALWVKREASRLMIAQQRKAERRNRRKKK